VWHLWLDVLLSITNGLEPLILYVHLLSLIYIYIPASVVLSTGGAVEVYNWEQLCAKALSLLDFVEFPENFTGIATLTSDFEWWVLILTAEADFPVTEISKLNETRKVYI